MRVRELVSVLEEDDSASETTWNYLVLQSFDDGEDEILARGTSNSVEDANKNILEAYEKALAG